MEITLIAVGRLKDLRTAGLCEEYAERIGRYGHRLRTVEVKEETSSRSDAEIVRLESERLAERIPAGSCSFALDLRGELVTSRKFAAELERLAEGGVRAVSFIVGGSLGLSSELRDSCDRRLALSRMTLPHELARLLLLEQIYRANTIQRGEPYHK